ncbi:serine/threonine protein kinase [Catenulispora rubra]|uniref:serine/threonine protein kinase n=1 Tax=Catenulispora rubra TaxID=280293 RepID=UPI001892587C|nr:serine/threonine-protein kinase [Catenulispora rubra]
MTQRLGTRRAAIAPTPGDEAPTGYHDLGPVRSSVTGTLFSAYSERLGLRVALRVAEAPASAAVARRFLREAEALGRLAQCANVAALVDAGVTDRGQPYTAREYFEDGSLSDLLQTAGPLPLTDVLHIGVLAAEALGSAHALGFLHQGVKPQNIMRVAAGDIALADFAIPALAPAPTQIEAPVHCAPEWLQGRPPSVAADVYSLGSTLFQLLAARPPYRPNGGVASLLLRMLNEEPPLLVRADVPPALAAVVARAMAGEPGERYQDAHLVAAALRSVQAELGLDVTGPVPGGTVDAGRPVWMLPEPQTAAVAGAAHEPESLGGAETVAGLVGSAAPDPAIGAVPGRGAARTGGRWRWPTAVGASAVAVAAVGAPLLFSRSAGPGSHPAPNTSSTSATSAAPGGQVAAGAPAQTAPPSVAAPAGVVVLDAGTTVNLRWTLPPGSELYPVLVQVAPASGHQSSSNPVPAPVPLPGATRAYAATGLDPAAGYCFQIGLLLRFGDASTPPTEVWSTPACVRGAVAAAGGAGGH